MKIARAIHTATLLFMMLGTAVRAAEPGPLKEGWNAGEIRGFTVGCTASILGSAKRAYDARAAQRGNTSPKPFPETLVIQSVEPMCNCIGNRVARAYPLQALRSQPNAGMEFVQEAMAGGQCKPEGVLADALAQSRATK